MANFLYEITPFKARIIEASADNKRMVIEGVFQASDRKNANGRIYPKSLWEKVLSNDNVKKAIEERRMFGELDHPQDGKWELKRASHIVTNMSMSESGDILGRAEILDTPNGKILQELFSAGAMVGISSRGSGSVKRTPDGEVVQEDYKLETYDFVANPSTFGAFPKVVSESTETEEDKENKENYMGPQEKLALLEQKAGSVLSLAPSDVTKGFRPVVESLATGLVIDLTKLGAESPELKSITESLVADLTSKRKELRNAPLTEKFPKKGEKEEEEEEEEEDEKVIVKGKNNKVNVKQSEKENEKESEKEESVQEETSGSADTGFHRSVPKEAEPAKGEGWPLNPGDAGVLAGINDGVDEFMSKSQSVVEKKDEDEEEEKEVEEAENPFKKGKKDKDDEDEEEKEEATMTPEDRLVEIALNLISVEATEENYVARAFAAAFLMENNKRMTESQAYARIVGKLQEKLAEAAETGKIVLVDEDASENTAKLEAAYQTIEELQTRHRLLSAKVYAEQELRKIGQHENPEARKVVAEAIRKAPTKKAIDEAIVALSPVRGLKVQKTVAREVKEEAEVPPAKNLEGVAAKLNEDNKPSEPKRLEGAELGKYLSGTMAFSRSTAK